MPEQRSTLTVLDEIRRLESGHSVPVLTGNTADLFVARNGAVMAMPHLLAHEGADHGYATVVFSLARGSHDLTLGGQAPATGLRHVNSDDGASLALADLLSQLESVSQPVSVLVDYSDLLLPAAGGTDSTLREQERVIELLAEQALAQSSRRTHHRMVVLSRAGGGLDPRLLQLPGFQNVAVGLPNLLERKAMLERLMHPTTGAPLKLSEDLDLRVAATLTGGLVNFDLMHARELCQATGAPLSRAWIQSRKSATISRLAGDALIVYPPGRGMADVAGLPQVRLLVEEYLRAGRTPRRILLAGPPGVGKTLVVRAIADALGCPVVALGNYRNMYVGETERRFRMALQVVQDLAPCVLHIDEIDQSVGQRTTGQSSDGGTSERVLADMWAFLGDNTATAQVTVIATTNRPELLDPAMFDRFEIIPVLHPTPTEAAEVLTIHAEREGHCLDAQEALTEVERYGQLLTGRVLVDVMDRAITLAAGAGESLTGQHLRKAFDELLTAVNASHHEALALRAVALTTFASRLPWEASRRLGQPAHVPYYLEGVVDPATGRTDRATLARLLGNA